MTTAYRLETLEAKHPISQLADALSPLWQKGWHPLDAARLLDVDRTSPGKAALQVYVDALSVSRGSWHELAAPLWRDQADSLGALA
ncbi:MAG: hypothetical protein ACC660_04790, partial [Acidimicrobiales bacterium]